MTFAHTATRPALALIAGLIAAPALAGPECVHTGGSQAFDRQSLCVSSYLAPQSGNRYDARALTDGSTNTAWCEGVQGHGVGEKMVFEWAGAAPLHRIWIINGYAKSSDSWHRNGRIRDIAVRVKPRGSAKVRVFQWRLADTSHDQAIEFPWAVNAPARVVIRIKSVYPGSKWPDTCVSEIWPDFGF